MYVVGKTFWLIINQLPITIPHSFYINDKFSSNYIFGSSSATFFFVTFASNHRILTTNLLILTSRIKYPRISSSPADILPDNHVGYLKSY